MRLAVLTATAAPWAPGVLEAMVEAGLQVKLLLFDTFRPAGYTDPVAAGLLSRFEALRPQLLGLERLQGRLPGLAQYLGLARDLRRVCRDTDLLLTLYGGGFGYAAMTSGVRPYAIYASGSDVYRVKGASRKLSRKAFEGACIVPANGQGITQAAKVLAPGANVVCHLKGIDTRKFTPGVVPEGPVRVVCSRGWLPVYDNETILKALAAMPELGVEWTMDFLAGGPGLADARAWAKAHLPAKTLQRVTFHGGVSSEEIISRFTTSAVFVTMSHSDSTSTALLEALASGLYPIMSDIDATRPWAEGGRLVPVGDHASLALALAEAIKNPELRSAARTRYPERIRREAHSVDQMRKLGELLAASLPK